MRRAGSVVMVVAGLAACDGGGSPIDAGDQPLIHMSVRGSGAGEIMDLTFVQWCANLECRPQRELELGQTYTFRQTPIAGSTFTGWSGCTPQPDGTCSLLLQGESLVTATYDAPPGVAWVRSAWPLYLGSHRIFLSATSDGVLAAGTGRDYTDAGLWVGHYSASGAHVSDTLRSDWPIEEPVVAFDTNADGVQWSLVAATGPTGGSPPRLRLDPSDPDLYPGGDAGSHGLAVDASGNVYISGVSGGAAYLASYDQALNRRWRIAPTGVTEIHALTIRAGVLVAGGFSGPAGWLGTFDLAGAPGWSRMITVPDVTSNLRLSALAIDGDGDIIYGGVATATTSYVAGAVSADGAASLWQSTFAIRTAGALAVHTDDTIRLWVGSSDEATAPSALFTLNEAGAQTAARDLADLPTPSGIEISADGTVYLAGPDHPTVRPAILRL